jgi:hypothetical protein
MRRKAPRTRSRVLGGRGGLKVDVVFGGFFFCWGLAGLTTLILFPYGLREAGSIYVKEYAIAAIGRMQYDYK